MRGFSSNVLQSLSPSFSELVLLLGSIGPMGSVSAFTKIVSLIPLLSALYVILSRKYPPKAEQWAYATVAMILGFWLRQA
jgi:hypothetical protein